MPTKRAVLAKLTPEELRANVDYYELEVADRRVKARLVDSFFSRSLERPARISSTRSMNSTQLKNLPLPVPQLDEQEEIVDRLNAIDGRLSREEECLRGLNRLRSALLSVLLIGELRVIPDGVVP